MNAKFASGPAHRFWMTALILSLPAFVHAQEPEPAPTPADPLAGIPVQVLDQQQVEIGTHKITYNRIAPPVFPVPTPPGATTVAPASSEPDTHTAELSRRTKDAGDGGAEKLYKMLFLSATVYDHQFTEVRSIDGDGTPLLAYVNIDFNYFTTVSNLETDDTVYELVFALSNDTADSIVQSGQQTPNLAAFPQSSAAYQIVAGDPTAHADDVSALAAICAFYDANKTSMIAAYNQQQASNAAYQQWLAVHPPMQPNTIINYWPIHSSVYLPDGQ